MEDSPPDHGHIEPVVGNKDVGQGKLNSSLCCGLGGKLSVTKLLLILVTSVALVTVAGVVTGVYIKKEKQPPLTTTATTTTVYTTTARTAPISQLGRYNCITEV